MRNYLFLTTAFLATLFALAGIKTSKERLPLSGIVLALKLALDLPTKPIFSPCTETIASFMAQNAFPETPSGSI